MRTHGWTTIVPVAAGADELFAFLDDHARVISHMGNRSLAMGGGSMALELDEQQGKAVGSRLRLRGRAFGVRIAVEEVVIERVPPARKSWETVGEPRLLVIGGYRMGFHIDDLGKSSRLTVFIDYDLPRPAPLRWLGRVFGKSYARWCTERMARDATKRFEPGQ